MIMKLVEKQGRITTADVVELLYFSDASAAYYEIKKLKHSGKLQSVSKGRNSYYVLPMHQSRDSD